MICELLPSLFLFKIAKASVALEGLESILSFIDQELKRILDINDNIDEEFTIFSFTVQTCCRICRWLKVVTMVMNMMESSSLNLYGDFFSRSKQLICFSYMVCLNNYFQSLLFLFFLFVLVSEFDRSCWIREFKNWDYWVKKKRRVLHKQKSSNSWNSM